MKNNKIKISETIRSLLFNKLMTNKGYKLILSRLLLSVLIPLNLIFILLLSSLKFIFVSLIQPSESTNNKSYKYRQEVRRRELDYQNAKLVNMLYNR